MNPTYCKNSIIMLDSVTGTQMNSFIITTEDGKVLVMDGGFAQDADNLIGWLKRVTGEEIPHVDGWFLSHPHLDHITCLNHIMETRPHDVTVDALYYNFPSLQYLHAGEPSEHSTDEFVRLLPGFPAKSVILWAGDVYEFGAARVECLCSPSPEFNRALNNNVYNNASCVLLLTLGGKKTIFLGDAGVEEGQKMLAMYAGTGKLKADYVQMAHHGQNGVERDFYEAVAPTGCFWCTPRWLWENDAGKGYNTHGWKTIIVRGWMEELGVRENYVMMNGVQELDL